MKQLKLAKIFCRCNQIKKISFQSLTISYIISWNVWDGNEITDEIEIENENYLCIKIKWFGVIASETTTNNDISSNSTFFNQRRKPYRKLNVNRVDLNKYQTINKRKQMTWIHLQHRTKYKYGRQSQTISAIGQYFVCFIGKWLSVYQTFSILSFLKLICSTWI